MLILAGTLSHQVKVAKNSVMKELLHLPSSVEPPLCWCSIRWQGDVFICTFIVEKRFLCWFNRPALWVISWAVLKESAPPIY